jgi:hypothetical protein
MDRNAKGSLLPSRDAAVGDIVYIKHKLHTPSVQLARLGRITTIKKVLDRDMAAVHWKDGEVTTEWVRDLVSLTKKLVIAQHDVDRFTQLIKDFESCVPTPS